MRRSSLLGWTGPLTVLGFMTGTSLDAVDMAVVETDGEHILALGDAGEVKLASGTRTLVEKATADALGWQGGDPEPSSFAAARAAVARAHIRAARRFLSKHRRWADAIDLVGVHGQTVLHEPPQEQRIGRSIQLVDPQLIADQLQLPVVHDFRRSDLAAGGQGAPLAPLYHCALLKQSRIAPPVAVLNLGGVANVTLWRSDHRLEAFDTGPANGMIDQLVQSRTNERMDREGSLAHSGTVDRDVLSLYLSDPFFLRLGNKSLDRFHFSLAPTASLGLADAAATLTTFAAQAVAHGLGQLSERPLALIVAGGGRRNPALMQAIRNAVALPVRTAEDVGWRGDSIEAEAFAFLAARSVYGLALSYPETTGAPEPLTGGSLVEPRGGGLGPASRLPGAKQPSAGSATFGSRRTTPRQVGRPGS